MLRSPSCPTWYTSPPISGRGLAPAEEGRRRGADSTSLTRHDFASSVERRNTVRDSATPRTYPHRLHGMRTCHSLQLTPGGRNGQDRPEAARSEEEGREPRQASERLIERDHSAQPASVSPGPVAIESHVTTNQPRVLLAALHSDRKCLHAYVFVHLRPRLHLVNSPCGSESGTGQYRHHRYTV